MAAEIISWPSLYEICMSGTRTDPATSLYQSNCASDWSSGPGFNSYGSLDQFKVCLIMLRSCQYHRICQIWSKSTLSEHKSLYYYEQAFLFSKILKFRHHKMLLQSSYRIFPKYSDTQTKCWNHSKIWTMRLYHRVMSPNDADGMANSIDPDQTARSSLIWVCTVCLGISVQKLRITTVISELCGLTIY